MSTQQQTGFHRTFYVANFMEILERLAWYGMYTLLALYLTSPMSQGGLSLSQTEKGLIMGVVPFFLYLFPIVSGALADRYGYRRMFIASFIIMAPCYYLLGHMKDMWSFMAVFMLVALGAGIFKPVVIGTIGRTTNAENRGLGFGIFYMMVNIGGALGPLIAPIIQKKFGWEGVFSFAALWISLNFIPVLLFYKEPVTEKSAKTLKQVFNEMQLVLGNARLALLVFPMLILIVAYNANLVPEFSSLSAGAFTIVIAVAMLLLSLFWDIYNTRISNKTPMEMRPWYAQVMRIGNKPFMVYLLIMSGFWTVYLQLFITLPSYIRDFVDTGDLVAILQTLGPWFYETFAAIDSQALISELLRLSQLVNENNANLSEIARNAIQSLDVRVPAQEVNTALAAIAASPELAQEYAMKWSTEYRQMNPSTLLGLDFIMIVFFQILISHLIKNYKVLPTLIAGTLLVSLGLWLGSLAHGLILGGGLIATSIIVFATGEMIASPKSQEYVASFAPKDQVALFMGYYFVAMALGNLFGGILSGWLYDTFAIGMQSPEFMWTVIALLGVATCCALFIFHRTMSAEITKQQLAVA